MDNLSVHKSKKVRDFIESNNMYQVFNAPYYPDGNPIELVFA